MATIGKNILENLTTGMYTDSLIIYREYIQNACDQIDKAVSMGISTKDESHISISINENTRSIEIYDNATGVKESDFESQLGDIANSDKKIGQDKGFRGIGRLCGLAYCKTLRFSTSYIEETVKSEMTIDAAKMRELIASDIKYTIDEVLDQIVTIKKHYGEPSNLHYFKVELLDINKENTSLLDINKVKNYLSFVAPVEYKNTFFFREKIKAHAKKLNYTIDEYQININGWDIFKAYTTHFYEGSENQPRKYDDIIDIEFQDISDNKGRLIAWLWYGICRFEKSIPKKANPMYGFRVRQGNIQIGSNEILAPLFREPRGNGYFVGEVFTVSHDLIPNSQRNYFNENKARICFERSLSDFFDHSLHHLYYGANKTKNDYKHLEEYASAIKRFKEKEKKGFTNSEERDRLKAEIHKKREEKEKAKRSIGSFDFKEKDSAELTPKEKVQRAIQKKYEDNGIVEKVKSSEIEEEKIFNKTSKDTKYFTDSLSRLDKSRRKIVQRIMAIVEEIATPEELKKIQERITEEFK